MKPRLPEELEAHNVTLPIEGILFVGSEGAIMAGFFGEDPQLFAKGKRESLFADQPSPRGDHGGPKATGARQTPWVQAAKGGPQSPGSFLNAGPITDTVNLGTVALRAGTKVVFDSENLKITNVAGANKYLRREYRSGWEL